MTLRIGEIAERSGVTPRTIRYYEELGLLPRSEREQGKHRIYTEADVERLCELTRLRDLLGLSLEELRSMITAEDVRADIRRRFHETDSREEQLALLGAHLNVQFQAHLVPLDQGEMSSCYVTPTRPVAAAELAELFATAYAHEPFVEVVDAPPGVREVAHTNYCRIFAAADEHTGKVLVFSAIDNLWKGTSSQAVQNLNLMYGLPETRGLL